MTDSASRSVNLAKKRNLRVQELTIPTGAAVPDASVADNFFYREHMDFIGFLTETGFSGGQISWQGAENIAEARAGNWRPVEFSGAQVVTVVETAGGMHGEDPIKFTQAYYLLPTSDTNQVADTVITGNFRQFKG